VTSDAVEHFTEILYGMADACSREDPVGTLRCTLELTQAIAMVQEQIARMRMEALDQVPPGVSDRDIARTLGVSHTAVQRWRKHT
jgi:DNA-binding transcriptional regulator YiaG